MKAAERYPIAVAALARLLAAPSRQPPDGPLPTTFALGPQILRPPPAVARATHEPAPLARPGEEAAEERTEAMLGELVDMVFVSANDAQDGQAEVHLVFKAEVLGGLHLRLSRRADGMHATFLVEDAAARRAVQGHIEALVHHLAGRGFAIASHAIALSDQGL